MKHSSKGIMNRAIKVTMIQTMLFLAAVPTASADQNERSGITATGTCLKKISQDRASATLTVSSLAPNANQASTETTKMHQKLRDALQQLKLANMTLETGHYTVGEEREWVNKKSVSKGFRASMSLIVETSEINRIGEVIATATKMGIKDVGGLNTSVSSEKYKSEYEGCLEIASRNARDKAIKLAKGAGVKLGKVKSIDEGVSPPNHGYGTRSVMMTRAFADGAAPADESGPMIDTKSLDLNVSATVTFDVDH